VDHTYKAYGFKFARRLKAMAAKLGPHDRTIYERKSEDEVETI